MIYDDFGAASWAAVIKESRAKHNRPEPEQPESLVSDRPPGQLLHQKSALESKNRPQPPPSVNDCPGGICDWAD